MKYIDADLLRKEIEKHIKEVKDAAERFTPNMGFFDAKLSGIYDVIAIIDSLQQEQESVAERFAKIVRGNLIGIDEEVQQKFENLYFEITGNKMYGGYND